MRREPYYYEFDVALPDGWTAEYYHNCHAKQKLRKGPNFDSEWEMKINIGENVSAINKIMVMISPKNHAMPIMVPIILLG